MWRLFSRSTAYQIPRSILARAGPGGGRTGPKWAFSLSAKLQTRDALLSRPVAPFPYNFSIAMPTSLDQIVAATRRRLAETRLAADLRELERRAAEHVPRGFRRALEEKSRESVAIIAELKKASPSRGLIRSNFN